MYGYGVKLPKHQVSFSSPDIAEIILEEESKDTRSHTGRLDHIDQDRVVINVFPLRITKHTQNTTLHKMSNFHFTFSQVQLKADNLAK